MLRLLGTSRATGLLQLVHDNIQRSIYLKDGRIISADSSDPRDFLGHFLVSRQAITEDQLNQAMVLQHRIKKLLGKTLIQMGLVTESRLSELLAARCREILLAAFLWEDGEFDFHDSTPPPPGFDTPPVETDAIILEGDRRAEEYAALRRTYPTRGICFQKTSDSANSPLLEDPSMKMIYAFVDGKRTVREIILQAHTNEYLAFHCLHALKSNGLVCIVHLNKEPTQVETFRLQPEDLLRFGKSKVETGKLEEAINVFRYVLRVDHANREAEDLLAAAEQAYVRQTYAEAFLPEAVPVLAKPLKEIVAAEKVSSEERFILSRVDGKWEVKSILTVTPLREVEALRIFRRLQERGMIRFPLA